MLLTLLIFVHSFIFLPSKLFGFLNSLYFLCHLSNHMHSSHCNRSLSVSFVLFHDIQYILLLKFFFKDYLCVTLSYLCWSEIKSVRTFTMTATFLKGSKKYFSKYQLMLENTIKCCPSLGKISLSEGLLDIQFEIRLKNKISSANPDFSLLFLNSYWVIKNYPPVLHISIWPPLGSH